MSFQLQAMLKQAIEAFHSGNLDSANLMLKRVLQIDSKNFLALYIIGLIKISQFQYKEATDYLGKASRLCPNDASIHYNLAKALSDSGNDKDALIHHEKTIQLAPGNPEAWLNYGKSLANLGHHNEALSLFDKALCLKQDYVEAFLNKGASLKELERYEDALVFAEKALLINSSLAEAWSNKAVILKELKYYDEAITCYDRALGLKPDYAEAYSNKGNALHELKRYDEAITCYDKALDLKPDYAEAYFNKGNALYGLKHYQTALAYYDKALGLKPDYAEAHSNKGSALHELKHYQDALAHYDEALRLKPDYAEGWCNKGSTLYELRQFDDAIAHYSKALSLKSSIDWVYGALIHAKMKIFSWNGLAEAIQDLSKKVFSNEKATQPFPLLALIDDPMLHRKSSEVFVLNSYQPISHLRLDDERSTNQKIRIGYFSADFGNHPVSLLTAKLFESHNRKTFEVFAFSFGPDDKSLMRLRLKQAFDQFIDVSDLSDKEIANLSRNLQIDLAIDLGGYTKNNRMGIFSHRAAPVQINWLGYPGTSGSDFIDYIIADKIIIPECYQDFYTEKVIYLPHTYMVDDPMRVGSSRIFTREECGLPQNGFVFCCFNNDYKFNPTVLNSWSRILLGVKNSVLWIPENNSFFKTNLIVEFERRNINAKRIIFANREELMEDHLARYSLADLFLDTFPYNAHTTAVDSLKMGIPVLTLMGQSFASRVAASLLHAIGLSELVTTSQESYEALAIELAQNPKKISDVKSKLANNRSATPMFDTPLFTKNLEAAYIKMHEQYFSGLKPSHFEIA